MKFKTIVPYLTLSAMVWLFSFAGCNSSKSSVQPLQTVYWGDGGGFTGIETKYGLTSDGQLTLYPMKEEAVSLRRVSDDKTHQVFSNVQVLNLHEVEYFIPGNMYKFIELPQGETVRRIAWDPDKTPNSLRNVGVFHRTLMNLVRK